MSVPKTANHCPCGSQQLYRECCRPLHRGEIKALNAEQLMRSRYSAYVRKLTTYIHQSWAVATRPELETLQSTESSKLQWFDLKIVTVESGEPGDLTGIVEFIAEYSENGIKSVLYERSHFVFEDETWYYLKAE